MSPTARRPDAVDARLVGGGDGHVGEALVGDEGLGPGVLQDVGHLGRHQVVVDRDQVPAGLQGGQVDLDHLGAVGQQGGDHVAHAEALGPQGVHHLVGPAEQLPGLHLVALGRHEGQVVGVFLGQRPEAEVTHQQSPCRSREAGEQMAAPATRRLERVLTYGNLRAGAARGPAKRDQESRPWLGSSRARSSRSPAAAAASGGPSRWPPRPRGPRCWWPTSAWAWPARTRAARWPTPSWRRSPRPAARRSPWPTTSRKMESGERLIATAVEKWGRIDGVVAVAGILRERMLFNMSEDEWDAVIATHLKGHFTVFRAAAAVMRKQEGGGALIGFTSGAFQGSVAQANYAAAKGGIVSLVRSAAVGLYRYGVTANAIAPVARTRMSANVPSGAGRDGRPRGRRADGRLPAERPGQARDRPGLHGGRLEDRRVEPARRGPGHVGRRPLDARADRRAARRQHRSGADGD